MHLDDLAMACKIMKKAGQPIDQYPPEPSAGDSDGVDDIPSIPCDQLVTPIKDNLMKDKIFKWVTTEAGLQFYVENARTFLGCDDDPVPDQSACDDLSAAAMGLPLLVSIPKMCGTCN